MKKKILVIDAETEDEWVEKLEATLDAMPEEELDELFELSIPKKKPKAKH